MTGFAGRQGSVPARVSTVSREVRLSDTLLLLQECSRVSLGLAARTSQGRLPFPGNTAYSSELVKYDLSCKGMRLMPAAESQISVH